ncbi:hypothetical protein [Radiobacillus deserti]|uniref:Uncharacterized protein n=1 Tax=Radiobacillus deserti TaxID=2594883 RepID=A0A516KJZ0_9BACI|nr:hypothetical protein [Radiobacillus deserti]QDP41699.1 hypothetical protein FN924_16865 [Radiobacillus deserti]
MRINIKTRFLRIILMVTIYTVWLLTMKEPVWKSRPGIFYFTSIMAVIYIAFQIGLIWKAKRENHTSS